MIHPRQIRPNTKLPRSAQGSHIRSPFGSTALGGGLVGQAQAMTRVKYGPEIQALSMLLDQARTNYTQSVSQNRAAADLIRRSVAQQAPILAGQTQRLTAAEAAAHQAIASEVGNRGGTLPQNEADLAAHQLGLTGQAAQAQLSQAAQRAAEGAAYQNQQARSQYQGDTAQVLERQRSLGGEAGDYASLALKQLLDAHNERTLKSKLAQRTIDAAASRQGKSIAASLLTHGVDAQGQVIPGSPQDLKLKEVAARAAAKRKANARLPGGAKPLPLSMQNSGFAAIDEAASLFKRFKGHADTHAIRQYLLQGGTDATNNIKFPKVPKILVNAAQSLVFRGGLSKANVAELHRAGYKIKGRYQILDPVSELAQNALRHTRVS